MIVDGSYPLPGTPERIWDLLMDPEVPDETLVAEARQGKVRAFETLLGRHEGRVLRVLRLLRVPGQDVEDVAQEVFIRVFRHLNGFQEGRSFTAWLYRVTVNAAHDYRSREGSRTRDSEPWVESLEKVVAPPSNEEGLMDRLEAALGTLSERERAVFVLREMEGLETPEVAKALGITSITVRRHLSLARERLRKNLERH